MIDPVATLADDVYYRFNSVIVVCNKPIAKGEDNLLYDTWRNTFDTVLSRTSIRDISTLSSQQPFLEHPLWGSIAPGVYAKPLRDSQSQKTVDEHLHALLGRLHDSSSAKRVLVLQHGVCSFTSNNTTWGDMNHRYPNVNFHLTTVMLDAADSHIFPLSVWTMRSSVWFAHHEFSRLEAAAIPGVQLTVLEDPSHARFISLLADNTTPAHVARLNAMRQRGEIQVQHVPAMRRCMDDMNDMDDPTEGKQELTQEHNYGIVSTEELESTTVEYVTRHESVNGNLAGKM
jgi:hypothetical protein